MPPKRLKGCQSRYRPKRLTTSKTSKLVSSQAQLSPRKPKVLRPKYVEGCDSIPVTLDMSVKDYSDNYHWTQYFVSRPQRALNKDDADEIEFKRKIAEARALLHDASSPAALNFEDASASVDTCSPNSAAASPSSQYYSPVLAMPSASLKIVKPPLAHAARIGIAMTEFELSLMEALLHNPKGSRDLEPLETHPSIQLQMASPAESESEGESARQDRFDEYDHSYAGYTIQYDDDASSDNE